MASDTDRVWDLMEKISICMLTTHDGAQIRSRPMAAFVRRDEDAIYFLGDAHHHKDEQIAENPNVGLAFADGQKFVSVTGHAAVSRDQAKIKELWKPEFKLWFPDGIDTPDIALLKVNVEKAEYWDSPSSKIVQAFSFVKALVTGTEMQGGENKKLNL